MGLRKLHVQDYRKHSILRKLYLEKKLSIKEIARLFNVDERTIWYWLIKNKIPRRKPIIEKRAKLNISKEELEELYIRKGFSADRIGKKFGIKSSSNILIRLHKYGIPVRDRYDAVSKSATKYEKKSFSNDLREKAYLIGFRTGDLEVRKRNRLINVRVSSTKNSQIELFKELFGKYGHVSVYYFQANGKREATAYTYLDNSFIFLLKKIRRIPKWIMNENSIFLHFLAGYSDAEGSWKLFNSKGRVKFSFYIGTQDREVLMRIRRKLRELGFAAYLYVEKKRGTKTNFGVYKKNLYALEIQRRRHVLRLAAKLLPLSRHKDKIERMKLILNIGKFVNTSS